jgi:hypothetical protein
MLAYWTHAEMVMISNPGGEGVFLLLYAAAILLCYIVQSIAMHNFTTPY